MNVQPFELFCLLPLGKCGYNAQGLWVPAMVQKNAGLNRLVQALVLDEEAST